jgi:hypothetical protein
MTTPTSAFLTERELSDRWKIARSTLAGHRQIGKGCPFVKIEGTIRYRLTDVERYEEEVYSAREAS